MSIRAPTPSHDPYGSGPTPNKGYGATSYNDPSHLVPGNPEATEFASAPANNHLSPFAQAQNGRFNEEFDASQRGSSILDGTTGDYHRGNTNMQNADPITIPSRSGTLKKSASVSRKGSLKRIGSRKSSRAGSVRSLALGEKEHYGGAGDDELNSAFATPVPTSGNPTDILAARFQAWRKVLKDLITYFRELQTSHEHRAKDLLKVSNVINNTNTPPTFLTEGGINDATHILRDFHKKALAERTKAKEIENDIIVQLSGLRSDLNQKIKEIKGLSGDFKNSVEKEMEGTRKAVNTLQEALGVIDTDPGAASGKGDPFVVKLGVDRQIEKQIDEENYLHRAFLNLEGSGRELESIVVGEIQKAYNAYAGILKREADEAYETAEKLRDGPVSMPKDREWATFVENDQHFVDPRLPLRRAEDITYPGKNHPAACEVRAGMLERKSKYLKSYTPGWYVLSPTHLHEFKSADRISAQPPVMSLYLPEQKLGSHSQPDSSSHKFMLKGRQTGSMHRGHSWVFRAESHDTMLAWYEDIKNLTEKSGEERNAFVVRHHRSVSGGSHKALSISSEGAMDEDEADRVPYSANASSVNQAVKQDTVQRPQPGGRFPSDLQVNRGLQAPLSASSASSEDDRNVIAPAGVLSGSGVPFEQSSQPIMHKSAGGEAQAVAGRGFHGNQYSQQQTHFLPGEAPDSFNSPQQPQTQAYGTGHQSEPERPTTNYGDWMAPTAAAAGGIAAGATGAQAYHSQSQHNDPQPDTRLSAPVPAAAEFSRVDSSASARGPPASEPSQTESASTVPTTIGNTIDDTDDQKLYDTAIPPVASYAQQPIAKAVDNSTSVNPPPTTGSHTRPVAASHLHIPGEFPPTPAS
ncbi:MAG: hypothetical protein M1819_003100 [Sarea resinae]|nr:MAG: hypothetical protein M1819_003100 [Sarea resinae]